MYNIFIKKVNDIGWCIDNEFGIKQNINTKWFEKNKDYFKFYGRDIETFLAKTKIAHSRRVFCKKINEKKKLTIEDMEQGLIIFLNNNEVKNRKEIDYLKKHLQFSLYS